MAFTLRLLSLVVLVASATCAQIDVATLIPKSTLVHLEITPGPVKDRGAELALAKIWNELDVQRFVTPLMSMLDVQIDQAEGTMREQVGIGFDDLVPLWGTRFTFSLLSITANSPGDPGGSADMLMTLDLGKAVNGVRGALDRFELLVAQSLGGTFADGKIAGRTVRVLNIGDADGVYYTLHESTLLVATTSATMERILGGLASGSVSASLSEHGDFIKARDRVRTDNTILWAFMDFDGIMDLAFRTRPEIERDVFELLYGVSYQNLGYGMDIDGRGVRERLSVRVPDDTSWTLASRSDATTVRMPELLPAETGIVTCGVMRFDQAYDAIMPTLDERYPREAAKVRQLLDTFGQQLGIDVRRDLLPSLGPEYAMYMAWPGAAVIPDIGFAFEVRKEARARVRDVIATVKTALAGDAEIRELTFRNTKIHWLDLSAMAEDGDVARPGAHTLKPSFALVRGYLVITLWPQSLKNLIHGLDKGTPRLKDSPDFKRLRAEVRGDSNEASLFYIDLARATGFLLDNGVPLLQMFVPPSEQVGIEMPAFPTSKSVTRHMFGMLGVGRWDGTNRMYSEIYSPVGMLPSYVASIGAMGAVLLVGFQELVATAPGASPASWDLPVPAPVQQAAQTPHERAHADLTTIAIQIRAFEAWEGRLPGEKEWAAVLVTGSSNHRDAYLPKSQVTDPWGRGYVFKPDGKGGFEVVSYGSDGKPGGEGLAADLRVR